MFDYWCHLIMIFLSLFFLQMICLLEKVEYWNHLRFMKLSSSINLIPSVAFYEPILFRISIVAIKMGRKGFVLLRCSHCSQSSKKVRAEIWRQELKHRPWWIGAYCIASHVLFILLSFATQNALLRGGTVLNDLDPPTSISNQDNTLQTSLQASLMQVFSQLRVLISKWL